MPSSTTNRPETVSWVWERLQKTLLKNSESAGKSKIKWQSRATRKPGKPETKDFSRVILSSNSGEIVPVTTKILDKEGNEKQITVTEDDGIRKETSLQTLAKLKPAFRKNGTTTAGNSSQVSDGAAAVVLVRRSVAEKLGLPILARFVDYAVEGVPPEIMGIGPAVAIPSLLKKVNKTVNDIDIWEINEAFASQATYSIEKLGISKDKLNPKGGALAIGHPLGCTGSRQIATLIPEMIRTGAKTAVVSMCIGTGMGAAAYIERE
jgi:acetyl-CoA acyltransferase 1